MNNYHDSPLSSTQCKDSTVIVFQISTFMEQVPVDGLWIDMNEPSNFCNGSCSSYGVDWHQSRNLTDFNITNPPYNLNNQDNFYPLNAHSLDVDAKQYGGHLFFNTHNLYGERLTFRLLKTGLAHVTLSLQQLTLHKRMMAV